MKPHRVFGRVQKPQLQVPSRGRFSACRYKKPELKLSELKPLSSTEGQEV